ncbi:MAG: TM2 domain-containing protein [Propionibacteriaceae bacterium]|nr:TM2 domain-containing protein [Propionibacteriaceae bacterium]
MSDTYGSQSAPRTPETDSLSLGPSPWVPTPPADRYVPLDGSGYGPGPFGQTPPGYPSMTPPGATPPPAPPYASSYAPTDPSGYQVYNPQAMPAQTPPPGGSQPYPVVYAHQPVVMVPGQVVQTPYGTFTVGQKSKLAAGLLGIFLGGFGVGQFYRGNVGMGVAQLLVSIFTAGIGALWGFIEGIVVLCAQPGSASSLDSNGQIMI